ncbi:peptidase M20 family protein [Gordonia effusa NBRC 100432]|uniref:Peptidase M20 family protein n=1 Tax=Gordonia effusa NBRC 100432 TaxID=1077974 RepID=H0QZ76_9ACTN|nr:N(2)-acetyl-L-2,4-diaminobutanoate deacetylase DoeB2 [Gordonia effusa]GAB18127.1 peptidase M20 family protein [Gordonia effusa NBRC 100432]
MRVEWPEVVAEATKVRHALHRRPEPAWAETDTARTVRAHLDALEISYRDCAGTGTVAYLASSATGRHVALRADLDAMPITESSGVAYSSEIDGIMHACGHDGHTATLLAVARWLKFHEDHLPGPVTLLFQPAEEGGHGAREMINDGCLSGRRGSRPVDTVFGWHNWPGLAVGRAICPDGAVMSANGTFQVRLHGRGGHASQPEVTRDPVLAAAAVTVGLQQVVARRLAPHTAAVVAVTSLIAESAATVTPEVAQLAGSVRIAETADRDRVFDLINQVAQGIAAAHDVTATVETSPRYDATVNHPAAAAELRDSLALVLGDDCARHDVAAPVMASEDFSYYLREIPGAFALIGAGTREPLHSAGYDFNDDLIDLAARVLVRVAGAPDPHIDSG